MGIKEIEAAILELPARDLTEFKAWFEDYCARVWDEQIEEDLEAGRLDALFSEVDREPEAGTAEPL
jgi:hypothetical protein